MFVLSLLSSVLLMGLEPTPNGKTYIAVIEGFDWGPAVSKIILPQPEMVKSADKSMYTVEVHRSSDCQELADDHARGNREIIHAYVSDAEGNLAIEEKYITLVLSVAPNNPLCSPIQYSRKESCRGNNWINYQVKITDSSSGQVWDEEARRIIPLIDDYDLSGKFRYDDKLTMSFAFYKPDNTNTKSPLIIWLHGGGEGGTDPSIPLIANRAANYASEDIQLFFGGAYVLVPQCPGAWMHNAQGLTTHGEENDIYNEGLMALIKDFVGKHPDIDTDRIYVGGCSNGGYMSLKLILLYPDYFAAGFISALAYQSQYITDKQIESIMHVPIWFVQSKDDLVTIPEKTVIPVYQRLKATGANKVHFTFYDHVTDITSFYGGKNYRYNGHWSWIYCHANTCRNDFDGHPVTIDDRPVTIMEWMAAQKK